MDEATYIDGEGGIWRLIDGRRELVGHDMGEGMMSDFFKLEGKEPVRVADCLEWAKWFESFDRCIARDEIHDAVVSTVFLGLDHRFGDGPPLIFETLVFGGHLDGQMDRYSTWDEAATGHLAMLAHVRLTEHLTESSASPDAGARTP